MCEGRNRTSVVAQDDACPVGARLRAMLLLAGMLWLAEQELSSAFGSRVTFSLRAQRESNQRERAPRLALAGHPARQVREPGPGFSTGHPALAKRSRHPCRLPLRGLSSPTHRRTGAPGRAAGHPGPHCWRKPEQSHSTVRGLSCSSTRQELQSQLLSDRLRL